MDVEGRVSMDVDFTELKKQAAEYYTNNQVPQRLEEILNSMFFENPKDIYGRLSEFFEDFALKPVLSKLTCQTVHSSCGEPSLKCSVYAIVKNHEKLLATTLTSLSSEMITVNEQVYTDQASAPTIRDIAAKNCSNVTELVSAKLRRIPLLNQAEVDKALSDWISEAERGLCAKPRILDDDDMSMRTPTPSSGKKKKGSAKKGKGPDKPIPPKEHMEPRLKGCSSVFAASQTILKASSSFLNQPPFEHLLKSLPRGGDRAGVKVTMPTVAMTIVCGGKHAHGKQNLVKSVFAIAKPSWSAKESVDNLTKVYEGAGKLLSSKGGLAPPVGPHGAYQPSLDKYEQAIDAVVEAINSCGLTPGQDVSIGVDCAAHEIFDYDKGKYEVATGAMKSADEMVDLYKDLVGRYPVVVMLIDPIRKEDREPWPKICEIIGDKCFVIGGEHIYGSLHNLSPASLCQRKSSGVAISNGGRLTLSELSQIVGDVRTTDGVTILLSSPGDVCDDIYSDVAVGVDVDFVRFGAPSRGENIMKLNRIIEIEDLVKASQSLSIAYRREFSFPNLKPPPPPHEPASDDDTEAHSTSEHSKGKKK